MASAVVHPLTNRQAGSITPTPRTRHLLRSLGNLFRRWQARRRERRTLELFDERDLRELGASRWQIERELSRRFWEP